MATWIKNVFIFQLLFCGFLLFCLVVDLSVVAGSRGGGGGGVRATGGGSRAAVGRATGGIATGSRATGSKATGSRATGSKATGSRATGSKATGSGATGSRATGSGATGSGATGSWATGIRATGVRATGVRASKGRNSVTPRTRTAVVSPVSSGRVLGGKGASKVGGGKNGIVNAIRDSDYDGGGSAANNIATRQNSEGRNSHVYSASGAVIGLFTGILAVIAGALLWAI